MCNILAVRIIKIIEIKAIRHKIIYFIFITTIYSLKVSQNKIFNKNNLKFTTMIYFYESTNKRDKLIHPLTISTTSERRAYALAVINFLKNHMIGSPKRIEL